MNNLKSVAISQHVVSVLVCFNLKTTNSASHHFLNLTLLQTRTLFAVEERTCIRQSRTYTAAGLADYPTVFDSIRESQTFALYRYPLSRSISIPPFPHSRNVFTVRVTGQAPQELSRFLPLLFAVFSLSLTLNGQNEAIANKQTRTARPGTFSQMLFPHQHC